MTIFERGDPLYDENPLIRHIDPILEDINRLEKAISYMPELDMPAERLKPIQFRLRRTGLFPRMHFPMRRDFEMAALLNEMICEGYVDRAPNARFWESHNLKVEAFVDAFRKRNFPQLADRCVGLMGIPGIGKSRLIKLLLRLISDPIQHADGVQVVSILVECPSDRKPGSLAKKIIRAVLRGAGDQRDKIHEGVDLEDVLGTAAAVCNLHFVGLIVVDDTQNAVSRSKKARTDIVDLLVELSNELAIPILFIGTPKAVGLLGREMRSARKILGPTWGQFSGDDEDWNELVRALWEYQWNKTYTPLNTRILKRIYELTQGVPAFLIRLLHFSVRRAILLGDDEMLTETILQETFETSFGPVMPMIRALASGDRVLLDLFEDLPKDFSLEEMLAREAEEFRKTESVALRKAIQNARKSVAKRARRRLALEGVLATPSQDGGESHRASGVVDDALNHKREPVEALITAGLSDRKA